MNKRVLLKKSKFYVKLIIISKRFGYNKLFCFLNVNVIMISCLLCFFLFIFFIFSNKSNIFRHFGIKCAKCNRNIQTSDWVRRAKDNVYHLACFACENCKRQLSTGEEFALHNNKLLCKIHYCEFIDGDNNGIKKIF